MKSARKLYLGIDGGGSKTAAVMTDEEGREIGRGWGGSCNLATQPDGVLKASIRDSVRSACDAAGGGVEKVEFAAVCAGVAGCSVLARRVRFATLLKDEVVARRYRIEPDYVTAWWGATHGEPGVIAIAGTGAVAYGRNAEGAACRVDGLGYLLGDRGGGFWIGLQALRHTVASTERGTLDALTAAVQEQTGTLTRDDLVQWLYTDLQPARVAALAPLIGLLADAHDEVAKRLLAEAALELRLSIHQALHTLDLPVHAPIYTLGGAWNLSPLFRAAFAEPQVVPALQPRSELDPFLHTRLHIEMPRSDAAIGAALMARNSGGDGSEEPNE